MKRIPPSVSAGFLLVALLIVLATYALTFSNVSVSIGGASVWRLPGYCSRNYAYRFVTEHHGMLRRHEEIISDDDHGAGEHQTPTGLQHIVFAIAGTAKSWSSRQEYVKLWWPAARRGFVWLDRQPPPPPPEHSSAALPEIRVSEDVAGRFPYTWRGGSASAVRVARVLSETLRQNLTDVRWVVLGDDDTVFFPANLAAVLAGYDHRQYYYIGQASESHMQRSMHSFSMAYGGGGIALSYALADALGATLDGCLHRYAHLYGSDGRIEACAAELGVPLTREPGFHQMDITGNAFGLLAAHPRAPLVSIHHIDSIDPIFPGKSRQQAIAHLINQGHSDLASLLQQSICYNNIWNLTFSVSWGYVIQIYDGLQLRAMDLQRPLLTFKDWHTGKVDKHFFTFGVRKRPKNPCDNPSTFFLESVRQLELDNKNISISTYRRNDILRSNTCRKLVSAETIQVFKLQQNDLWFTHQAPRHQCCEVISPYFVLLGPLNPNLKSLYIHVRDCERGEVRTPHLTS